MNILLIFFALPIATIIISIALQKLLKCPLLVASVIFAIFLIVTFIVNDLIFLVATIVYTIISFLTALIVCIICKFICRDNHNNSCFRCTCNCNRNNERDCERNNIMRQNELLRINSSYQNNNNNGELLTINSSEGNEDDFNSNTSNNNQNCDSDTINSNGVTAKVNVIPNNSSNDNSGYFCGNYRRRY